MLRTLGACACMDVCVCVRACVCACVRVGCLSVHTCHPPPHAHRHTVRTSMHTPYVTNLQRALVLVQGADFRLLCLELLGKRGEGLAVR